MRTAHKAWAGTFAATFVLVAAVQCSGNDSTTGGSAAASSGATSSAPRLGPTGLVANVDSPANILALPFVIWWVVDHEQRKNAAHASEQDRWRMWDRMMLSGHHPPAGIDPEHEARMAELNGLEDSARFWRDQPRIDRDDPQAWKERLDYAQRWTLEQRRAGRPGF